MKIFVVPPGLDNMSIPKLNELSIYTVEFYKEKTVMYIVLVGWIRFDCKLFYFEILNHTFV